MRGEMRNHSTCTLYKTHRNYTDCHSQVANTVLHIWIWNVDFQRENPHIVMNMRHNPCCRTHLLDSEWSIKNYGLPKYTFHVQWLFSENHAIYELMSKNFVEPGTLQIFIIFHCNNCCTNPPQRYAYADIVYVFMFSLYILYMLNNLTDVLRISEKSFQVRTGSKARKNITGKISLDVSLI